MSGTEQPPTASPPVDRPPRGADLAEACVREALAVIERSGVESLSLREVARRLGVSHQAPYRHFPSRDHLLAEIVRRSFDDLTARLGARPPTADPYEDLANVGRAYVAHAGEHPLAYRLMFGMPLPDPAEHPEVSAAARRAFAVVRAAVARVHAGGAATDHEIDVEALVAWAKVHGMATLPRVPAVAALGLDPGVLDAAADPARGPLARELGASSPR
jgi:AcrR family transcriptional regulator